MRRLARSSEALLVHERLEAELRHVERETGIPQPNAPGPGAIEAEINAGGRWYIDDREPREVASAFLASDGVVYVRYVYGPSDVNEERLRFLANELFNAYGDRPYEYASVGLPITQTADSIVNPVRVGDRSRGSLRQARDILNLRAGSVEIGRIL